MYCTYIEHGPDHVDAKEHANKTKFLPETNA